MFNTGAIVPLHWGWSFKEKYFLIGMWQQTRDFKGQTGTLETCHSVFIRDCAFHLRSWRVQDSALPQQDSVWLSQQGHSRVTKPCLWWDAVELPVTQLGREDKSLVLSDLCFLSVQGGAVSLLSLCVHDAQLRLCLAVTGARTEGNLFFWR